MAFRRLRSLHPDWSYEKLGEVLYRTHQWVSNVFAADRVRESVPATGSKLSMRTKSEISRAPKHLWAQISQAAQEQGWTRDETKEKVQKIKAEPERAQEIIQPVKIEVLCVISSVANGITIQNYSNLIAGITTSICKTLFR